MSTASGLLHPRVLARRLNQGIPALIRASCARRLAPQQSARRHCPTYAAALPAANPWADAIAAIDGLANELADIHLLVDRLGTGTLRFAGADRLHDILPEG